MLIIDPNFFLCTGSDVQMAQKQKSRTTKSPLMQDWVFRLGCSRCLYYLAAMLR